MTTAAADAPQAGSPHDAGAAVAVAAEQQSRRDHGLPDGPGRTELGAIRVSARAVETLVGRAVMDVPDARAPRARALAAHMAGAVPGLRGTGAATVRPRVDLDVDLSVVSVDVSIGVRWPAPVSTVTAAVRASIIDTVHRLTGLRVLDVRLRVGELVADAAAPRVQ